MSLSGASELRHLCINGCPRVLTGSLPPRLQRAAAAGDEANEVRRVAVGLRARSAGGW